MPAVDIAIPVNHLVDGYLCFIISSTYLYLI